MAESKAEVLRWELFVRALDRALNHEGGSAKELDGRTRLNIAKRLWRQMETVVPGELDPPSAGPDAAPAPLEREN